MSLQPWATVHIDRKTDTRKEWEPTTARSEELFRQRSVTRWSSRISQAQKKTWDDLCRTGIETFREFSQIPDDDDDDDNDNGVDRNLTLNCKTVADDPQSALSHTMSAGNDTTYEKFALEPSTDYPFDLLPCLIVNEPPSCKLDRQALMQSIYLSQKQVKGTATVLLPRLLPTLRQILSLVWQQIAQQERNRSLSRYVAKRFKKNRRTQSLQKWIIWWASRTERFDKLVILLEDPGGFAETEVRRAFYRCVGDWRKEEGLPVSMIVMGTQEQVRDLCPLEARIQVLSPQYVDVNGQSDSAQKAQWIYQFLHNLILDDATLPPPPVKWGKILLKLLEDFQYHHGSCTKFVQELKAHVMHFFATRGSFAWDLQVDQERWGFLAWFCTYENAKEYLQNSDSGWENYQALDRCVRMQRKLWHFWKGMIGGLPLFLQCGKNEAACPIIPKRTIPILAGLYRWVEHGNDDSDSSSVPLNDLVPLRHLLDPSHRIMEITCSTNEHGQAVAVGATKAMIWELIVLVHACDHDGTTEGGDAGTDKDIIQSGLINMIQMLFEQIGEEMDSCFEQWIEECPILVIEKSASSMKGGILIRREIIEDLPQPARLMYSFLQDRLSIKREDWLYDFGGSADDFAMGVWMLTVVGLVQSKRIRGGGILYEKVAVVWTSTRS